MWCGSDQLQAKPEGNSLTRGKKYRATASQKIMNHAKEREMNRQRGSNADWKNLAVSGKNST